MSPRLLRHHRWMSILATAALVTAILVAVSPLLSEPLAQAHASAEASASTPPNQGPHCPGHGEQCSYPPAPAPGAQGTRPFTITTPTPTKRPLPPKSLKITTPRLSPGHAGNETPAGWLPPIPTRRGTGDAVPPVGAPSGITNGTGSLCSNPCTPPLVYNSGGKILHTPSVFLVFWGPKWTDTTQPDYQTYQDIIDQETVLFDGLAGSGYNGILTQYSDGTGNVINSVSDPVLQQAIEDNTAPPASIDQNAEASEIKNIAAQIPNWSTIPDKMVILLPQEGSTYSDPNLKNACGYHFVTNDGNNRLYALVPYLNDAQFEAGCVPFYGDSGATDPLAAAMTVVSSHEYAETVTDPWVNNASTIAWRDQQGANEIGDLCAPQHVQSIDLGDVWVQDLFDNSDRNVDGTQGCDATSVSYIANSGLYYSPGVFAEYEGFYGIEAASTSDIWSVGYCYCGFYQTLAEHFNGSSWQVATAPAVVGDTNAVLMAVSKDPATADVWAAGNSLNSSTNFYQTLIEHYNGSSWSVVPSPNAGSKTPNSVLYGITVISETNIWAVGETYTNGDTVDKVLIEHYNGTKWSIVSSPSIANSTSWLRAVSAVPNTKHVWAVGGQTSSGTTKTLVEYYNGTSWSISSSSNLNQSTSYNSLTAVTAVSSTDIVAVGNYTYTSGVKQPLIGTYSGSSWAFSTPSADNLGDNYYLTGVGVSPTDSADVWVAGYTSNVTLPTDQPLLLYAKGAGTGGAFFPCAAVGTGQNELRAIAVVGSDNENVWVVGAYDNYYGYVLINQYT